MSTFNAYPPIRHHSSQPISPSNAQQLLASFLQRTATDPSLDPSALLTEDGPVSRSASIGLVLNNLRRVEAGLRGEHIAAHLSFGNFGGEGLSDFAGDSTANCDGEVEKSWGEAAQAGMTQQADWQDKDEYERQQTIERGDVRSRSNAIEVSDVGQRIGEAGGEIPPVRGLSREEKMVRRRRKREKREQMKREREKELSTKRKI
ncbi:MAG: hypothetical protein Q9216_000921 [Gyalolechia sp. 2 TL-2023]